MSPSGRNFFSNNVEVMVKSAADQAVKHSHLTTLVAALITIKLAGAVGRLEREHGGGVAKSTFDVSCQINITSGDHPREGFVDVLPMQKTIIAEW
jgi:hypothetical protein